MVPGMKAANPHTAWRIEFARNLVPIIASFEGVEAVIIAGSVARGYADAYSDLELPIFWRELPGDEQRLALVKALKGTFLFGYDSAANEDQLLIDGLQVDLWQNCARLEDEVIEQVLANREVTLGDSNFMDTLRACIPLYGHTIVEGWKAKAQAYPAALALDTIRNNLPALRVRELDLYAARGHPNLFYAELSSLQQAIFRILLALNHRYFPTYKWMYPVLDELTLKPTAISSRFRSAFEGSWDEVVAQTSALMYETLSLVESAYPSLDTSRTRRILTLTRPILPD
jgi:hypothetical protein